MILAKFLRYVGVFGPAWRGVIFRREYKHLDDVLVKAKKLFRLVCPQVKFLSSKSDYKFVWPGGEELLLRTMKDPEEYWSYHGHEFPFIAWEELTSWPNDLCFEAMRSTNRCSIPGVPLFYVATTNPFGAGHGWVKLRFIDPAPRLTPIADHQGNLRVAINCDMRDNRALMEADPGYAARLGAIGNDALREAWLRGNWDIAVGGFLQGIWDPETHIVDPFPIPRDWPRWRAMDWGFGKPYSVGWYTRDPAEGIIYRYRELYGWGGKPDLGTRESPVELAERIRELEALEREGGCKFTNNPADTNLWQATSLKRAGEEITPAELMRVEGVGWSPAHKGPGSRVAGAQVVVHLLKAGRFAVFGGTASTHWRRTVPVLMPDPDNWEDVDTESEDHAWDETRYSLVSRHRNALKRPQEKDSGPAPYTFDWLLQYGNPQPKRSKYRRI